MPGKKIKINKTILEKLYLKKNLSPYKIAPVLHCSFTTVTNRLNEYGIPLKSPASSRMRYAKKDFNGTLSVKAYMIGFRIGDLNVYKVSKNSETIVVRCHTTQESQINILKSLFGEYGKVTVSKNKSGNLHANCFLNTSFNFLLPKSRDAWLWLRDMRKPAAAFIAGYTDAEGNFILNQRRARFKIDSYDYDILNWASFWLFQNNIANKLRRIYKKGDFNYFNGKTWNNDLWRLYINEANAVKKFIILIMPFLMHKKRIKDAKICLKNITERKLYGTVR